MSESAVPAPSDQPRSDTFADSPPASALTDLTSQLVAHYADAVTDLREIRHRLDNDDLPEVELRRALGVVFANSTEGLAIARGFHASIGRLRQSGDVSTGQLLDDESVTAVLAEWLEVLTTAVHRVVVDLVSIDSLAAGSTEVHDEQAAATRLALISSLAANAVVRLDHALPPMPEA